MYTEQCIETNVYKTMYSKQYIQNIYTKDLFKTWKQNMYTK